MAPLIDIRPVVDFSPGISQELMYSCTPAISCFYIGVLGSSCGNTGKFTFLYEEVHIPIQGSSQSMYGEVRGKRIISSTRSA